MKGEISICDEFFESPIEFETGIGFFDLDIFVSKEHNLDKFLQDKATFIKLIDRKLHNDDLTGFHDDLDAEIARILKKDFDSLLDYVEFIRINPLHSTFREMIDNNPIVLTKKVVLDKSFQISDYEELKRLALDNADIKDKLYIILEGNSTYIPIDEAIKTVEKINETCEIIKSYNLSQIETIMLVYDYVRDRVYQSETNEENYKDSRDLTSVLFGDKIVCSGFTHLFNSMLNYLNIDYEEILYSGIIKDGIIHKGHVRSLVYVNDDKYDIQGLYLFDPTWDCKKNQTDKDYLSRYKYFARNVDFMEVHDVRNCLEQNRFLKYYKEVYFISLYGALKNNDDEMITLFIESLNHMARRILGTNLIEPRYAFSNEIDKSTQRDILKKFAYIVEYFKREIPAEKMMQIVNNVRKIEYYDNPDKYPYDIDTMYKIAIRSKWNFDQPHLTPKEKLIKAIFDIEIEKRGYADDVCGYIEETGLERDIQRVKVAKTLRRVLEKKTK